SCSTACYLLCCWCTLSMPGEAQRISTGEGGAGPSPRPDPVRAAELRATTPLTTGVREDDHPALCAAGNRLWVAWVSYSESEGATAVSPGACARGRWAAPPRGSQRPRAPITTPPLPPATLARCGWYGRRRRVAIGTSTAASEGPDAGAESSASPRRPPRISS